jgi:hypothetical protein
MAKFPLGEESQRTVRVDSSRAQIDRPKGDASPGAVVFVTGRLAQSGTAKRKKKVPVCCVFLA